MSNYCALENKILYISRCEYNYFLNKKNVVGIGLGFKDINGFSTYKPCIKIFVEKKLDKNVLNKQDLIPLTYKGIKTDVTESGPCTFSSLTKKIRPCIGGYSISNVITRRSGTLGCMVTDGYEYYILSNNHILAAINRLPPGTAILQPSNPDGGKYDTDRVALLKKFVRLVPNSKGKICENFVDCAIALIINVSEVSAKIAFVGGIKGVHLLKVGDEVKKVGRTTELTTGKVKAMGMTINTTIFSEKYTFKDQIATTRMSQGGDSGSILLDSQNYAAGLLYSGTPSYSVFNPIRAVLGNLGVTIVTS